MEPESALSKILQGGLGDKSALREGYGDELLQAGQRPGYPTVARGAYQNLPSVIAARSRYPEVKAPTHLVYGEKDPVGTAPSADDEVGDVLAGVGAQFEELVLLNVDIHRRDVREADADRGLRQLHRARPALGVPDPPIDVEAEDLLVADAAAGLGDGLAGAHHLLVKHAVAAEVPVDQSRADDLRQREQPATAVGNDVDRAALRSQVDDLAFRRGALSLLGALAVRRHFQTRHMTCLMNGQGVPGGRRERGVGVAQSEQHRPVGPLQVEVDADDVGDRAVR